MYPDSDWGNFKGAVSDICNRALNKKIDVDCERNDAIAARIGEVLSDAVEGGERDAARINAMAEELADIAQKEWCSAECQEDDGSFAQNLLACLYYEAEKGRVNGVSLEDGVLTPQVSD